MPCISEQLANQKDSQCLYTLLTLLFSMNQKRGALQLELVIVVVLLLAVMGIVLFQLYRGQLFLGAKYNALELQVNANACREQGQFALSQGRVIFDNDFGNLAGDGFPDGCDSCLGGDDRKVDQDGDFIPDACDNDPQNPPEKGIGLKKICEEAGKRHKVEGQWDDKKKQCRLKGIYGTPRGRTI
jgi:hypothetical protein